MVYDRDLKYVRRIVGTGIGQFCDISPDSEGNLYVTDWGMKCIQVFSHYGGFLWSFGVDNDSGKLLTRPLGICVARQFVYVCNNGLGDNNHSVYLKESMSLYLVAKAVAKVTSLNHMWCVWTEMGL